MPRCLDVEDPELRVPEWLYQKGGGKKGHRLRNGNVFRLSSRKIEEEVLML